MNSPARPARSSTGPGTTPRTSVTAAPIAIVAAGEHRRVGDARRLTAGRGEVHQPDHADVEERRDDAAQDGHHDDRVGARRQRRREHRPLPDEAGGQRDAGHGEQEEREDARHQRRLLAEAGPPREVGLLATGVTHQRDHGEGAHGREAVGDEVEQHGLQRGELPDREVGRALDAEHAGEQEAGVGDRGVGQHPLHVGLRDGEHRADEHGEDRDDPHHRLPGPAVGAEGDVEQAQHALRTPRPWWRPP